MVRIITCLTLFLALLALVSGQSVGTLNTPEGPIAQNATVPITWTLIATPMYLGVLTAIDKNTTNVTTISNTVDLSALMFNWTVNVPPDTYNLALNDGSGQKFSGPVQVIPPPPTAPPATGPAPPASGPAPPASGPGPAGPAAAPASTPKALVERDVSASASSSAQPMPSSTQSAGNSVSIVSIYNILLLGLTSVVVCLL